jgi:hypothetical protein
MAFCGRFGLNGLLRGPWSKAFSDAGWVDSRPAQFRGLFPAGNKTTMMRQKHAR